MGCSSLRGTGIKVERYFNEFSNLVFPVKIEFKKMSSEIQEHFQVINWVVKRTFIFAAIAYILLGIIFKVNILSSLVFGFLVFLYSNFLPDSDSLFSKLNFRNTPKWYEGYARVTRSGKIVRHSRRAKWYEKYLLLLFAPLFIYYRILRKINFLYTDKEKEFHNIKSMLIYSSFLCIIGFILYSTPLESLSIPAFGALGYYTHLLVDKRVVWR